MHKIIEKTKHVEVMCDKVIWLHKTENCPSLKS